METYPVDLDAEQIVRWFKAEHEAAPSAFRITARRSREVEEIPFQKELHFGDAEREDLSEVATIATLEIAPVHAREGWLLTVVVEDEIGPRISDRTVHEQEEQQIDLGTFYKEFIHPERGNANVTAEVENSAARDRLNSLLNAIEQNRHDLDRGASRG